MKETSGVSEEVAAIEVQTAKIDKPGHPDHGKFVGVLIQHLVDGSIKREISAPYDTLEEVQSRADGFRKDVAPFAIEKEALT